MPSSIDSPSVALQLYHWYGKGQYDHALKLLDDIGVLPRTQAEVSSKVALFKSAQEVGSKNKCSERQEQAKLIYFVVGMPNMSAGRWFVVSHCDSASNGHGTTIQSVQTAIRLQYKTGN